MNPPRRTPAQCGRAIPRALPITAVSLALLATLSGCASVDPLEPINRKVFAFNDAVDGAVLRPTAVFYRDNVPSPVRTGVRNFFGNAKDAWSAVNLMLQGRVGESFAEGLRFSVNSVFGLAGLLDIATEMGIESQRQDFGLTLGRWGLEAGPYIVWPLLGPSTLRDSVGLPLDMMATSTDGLIASVPARNTLAVLRLIDTRTSLLPLTDVLDDVALDRYTFLRDGYLQRRENLIQDSDPAYPQQDSSWGPLPSHVASAAADSSPEITPEVLQALDPSRLAPLVGGDAAAEPVRAAAGAGGGRFCLLPLARPVARSLWPHAEADEPAP